MMRYVPSDKYTIAWFKLAECVAKGEKEKAFGVYRLLMHSLEDQAYAYQLEGDLLHAFADERAVEKYAFAAQLYYASGRYKEAASIYKELIFLMPEERPYIHKLLEIYQEHINPEMFKNKLFDLIDQAFEKNLLQLLFNLIQFYETDLPFLVIVYDQILRNCAHNYTQSQPLLNRILEKAMILLSQPEYKQKLQELLSWTEQQNQLLHATLIQVLNQK